MTSTPYDTSFDDFYNRERDLLGRALAITIGDPVEASEVVDEAMARAFQNWHKVSQLDRPGGWVYRVALNMSRSRFRRLRNDIKYRWLSLPVSRDDITVDDAFADQIEDDRLLAAMLELPAPQRAVVVARVLLDYSEADTAEVLGVAVGTVKSRLNRALQTLRQRLGSTNRVVDQNDSPSASPIPSRRNGADR